MKRFLTALMAMLTAMVFAGTVMAQAPATPAAPANPADKPMAPAAEQPKMEKAPKPMKFFGSVTGYEEGKMLKLKAKDKEMSFDLTGDTKVKGELKEGAKAAVWYKKDGDKMVATSVVVAAAKRAKAEKKAMEKAPEKPMEKPVETK